jgi:hypothetical protein
MVSIPEKFQKDWGWWKKPYPTNDDDNTYTQS